jgi:copper chaperone CopZ
MSTTSYTVVGMTCGHCVNSVSEEVSQVPGVTDVDVDLASGGLTVTSDTEVDDDAIQAAVEEAGYQVPATRWPAGKRLIPPSPCPATRGGRSHRRRPGAICREERIMNTATKLGGFTLGLLAAFGAAAGIGNAVGAIGPAGDDAPHDGGAHTSPGVGATADSAAAEELPGGLMISQHGYTLDLGAAGLSAGPATPVVFRILGPDGQALTDYDASHDEDLHLIAVRRDLTGFQHVHPELGPDGTWTTPLELTPGAWRLFADFDPAGADEALTLGADVPVAGQYTPQPLPEPSRTGRGGRLHRHPRRGTGPGQVSPS